MRNRLPRLRVVRAALFGRIGGAPAEDGRFKEKTMRKLYLVLLGFAFMTPGLFAEDHARDHRTYTRHTQNVSHHRSRARERRLWHQRARHHHAAYRREPNRHWRDHNRRYEYRHARYAARHREGLPPGIAKRGGDLPPGLQKHVDRTGHLPPGLEKKTDRY